MEREGTIRFAYDLRRPRAAVGPAGPVAELNAWRSVLVRLGMVGQDPNRYDGYGFGNLSFRLPPHGSPGTQAGDGDATDPGRSFVITASQTGAVAWLNDEHLVRVYNSDLDRFWVDAIGAQPPSSETLTHDMLYRADARLHWVMHGHCPSVWRHHTELKVPAIDREVEYGTAAMAAAVAAVLESHQSRPLAFVTLGHTDGVFACGATARDTANTLINLLARALTMEKR